jgi:hypothetical protein
MQRVYGLVKDDLVHRIDSDASLMGISRSKWLGLAIETFLNRNGDGITGDHRDHSGESNGDDHNQEIAHLKQIISIKDNEIQHLRYLTNDLRSLADNLADKVLALPGTQAQDMIKPKKITLEILGQGGNHIKSIYRPYPR